MKPKKQTSILFLLLCILAVAGGCDTKDEAPPLVVPPPIIVDPPEEDLPAEEPPAEEPEEEDDEPEEEDDTEKLPYPPLAGTGWKWAGIFDTKTGVLAKTTEKSDSCELCFTLWFETDSTGYGHAIFLSERDILVDLSDSLDMLIQHVIWIMPAEEGDRLSFLNAIDHTMSYAYEEDELKFFYEKKKKYLLFKRIKK